MIWLLVACTLIPEARVAERLDTDDDGVAWPEDCDPGDNAVGGPQTWFPDADGDRFGSPDAPIVDCVAPEGHVLVGDDCDDAHAEAHPGAIEACAPLGVDDDCDGQIDEDDPDVTGTVTFSTDGDEDGFGGGLSPVVACQPPTGAAAGTDDCDDADADVFPGQIEVCNNDIDDDCDGGPGDCRLQGSLTPTAAAALMRFVSNPSVRKLTFGTFDGADTPAVALGCTSCVVGGVTGAVVIDALPTSNGAEAPSARLYPRSYDFPYDYTADVVGTGDWNGDGVDDVVFGAGGRYSDGYNIGGAYVAHGPFSGDQSLETIGLAFSGKADQDTRLGYSVAGLGDVDGDGFDDLAIGAPGWTVSDFDADPVIHRPFGALFLLNGPVTSGGAIDSVARTILGEEDDGRFCASYTMPLGAAGDVDGDGLADILVGAPNYCIDDSYEYEGRGYLLNGPADTITDLADADSKFLPESDAYGTASAVTGLGDVSGDGLDDVALTQKGLLFGSIYVVNGPALTTLLADANSEIVAGGLDDGSITDELSRIGDLDGDGFADLAVAAQDRDANIHADAGAVYLVYGPLDGRIDIDLVPDVLIGTAIDGGRFGAEVGGRDIDGDGRNELIVIDNLSTAAPNGGLYVFSGVGL